MQEFQPSPAQPVDSANGSNLAVTAKSVVKLLRPRQWTKNFIVFAPALFGSQLLHGDVFSEACQCAVAFCLASSSIYIVNDLLDREKDRLHPVKCKRPIASGMVGITAAVGMAIFLSTASVALSTHLGPAVVAIISTYILLMLAYSKWLKSIALIDIFVIAAGFVLRALAGAAACAIEPSAWFLLCTIFAALFLSIEKRNHEVRVLSQSAGEHRKSLAIYTPELLGKLQSVITSSMVMSYALYSFHSPHGQIMLITVPFVIFAVMRYQLLSVNSELTGTPEEVLLKDAAMRNCVMLWVLTCAAVVYNWIPHISFLKSSHL